MFRPLSRGQLAFDVAVPATIALVLFIPYAQSGLSPTIVLLGMCAALAFWRLNAGISLAIAWSTASVQMLIGGGPNPANLAIPIVLFATSAYGNRLVKWLGFASVFVGAAAVAVYWVLFTFSFTSAFYTANDLTGRGAIVFLGFFILFALSWTLGLLAKAFSSARDSRRAQTAAELEQKRARQDVVVEQERTRIARDMHDVVAHSLAVVIAQADGARYARHADPDAVESALITISGTARDALGDVRMLLEQLRHSQPAGPQPTLEDLGALLAQLRAAGLDIRFEQTGRRERLGSNQQIALYRIIQEALTNALRHGDRQQPVNVVLDWHPDRVTARISNTFHSADAAEQRPGHGLSGMRERASLVGGRVEIAAEEEIFLVAAAIPRLPSSSGGVPVITAPVGAGQPRVDAPVRRGSP